MKAVVIGALAASAYSARVYPGYYTLGAKTTTDETKCCWPTGNIKITQPDGAATTDPVNVEFTFDPACPTTAIKGTSVDAGSPPDSANNNDVSIVVGSNTYTLETPTLDTDSLNLIVTAASSDSGTTGCEALLTKAAAVTGRTYQGLYEVDTPSGNGATTCCFPTGDIIVRQATSSDPVSVEFTYAAAGANCAAGTTLAGTTVSGSGTADANSGDVYFTSGTDDYALVAGPTATTAYKIDLSSIDATCSVTLKTKALATHTYPGVFTVSNEGGASSNLCCYPDANGVTVTQDATTKEVTVGWTFENTDDCKVAALKGVAISGKGDIDAVTKNVPFTDESINFELTYPQTATADWVLDLSGINAACSATLEKKSGYLVGLGSLVALSLSYIMF